MIKKIGNFVLFAIYAIMHCREYFFWQFCLVIFMTINETNGSFAEMLSQSMDGHRSIEGSVVRGTVVSLKNDKAVIDVGLKSEGRLFINDIKTLTGKDTVDIGDTIDVYVEKYEDKNGEPILSIEKAKKEAVWNNLNRHMIDGTSVDGIITGRTRGGLLVDIDGTQAFLPGSHVDLRPVKDITPLLNIKQPFKVLKMDKQRNNIVVSRRNVLEEARNAARDGIISGLSEGMVLDGVVKNITEYGAFVDIGGIDGLLHITDISWKRVSTPSEVISVGEHIKVQVLKFNASTGRISLGMKQLLQTPWENIEERYHVGQICKGTVVNITDYGAFVEMESCIEGMVHMSEVSWHNKTIAPSKVLTVGQEVDVMVLDVNQEKKKISLSIKRCQPNPWQKFADEHKVGEKLHGIIRNVTEFGIFVEVAENLDGMVHISDISWKAGTDDDESKNYQKGQEIDVIVLGVDPEKERINLGIKQLEEDPYADAIANTKKGSIVKATVENITDGGIDVKLENGLPGFIKRAELSSDRSHQRSSLFAIGSVVEGIVVSIDKSRVVNLSIKALEIQEERQALESLSSQDKKASIGDILDSAIHNNDKETK